jgi:protein-tyrosine phosphatase
VPARGSGRNVTPVIDLHFIAPRLAVGAHFPMEAAARLAREHGISRVVDVRIEACDDEEVLRVHGIQLLHLPTHDTRAVSQDAIAGGVAFASEGLDRGESVLVHCQWGIGRRALLGVAILVARGQPPLDALEQAKRARPIVSPSPEQLEALVEWSRTVKAERGARWRVPTVDELGGIAWRHLRGDAEVDREEARAASTRDG